MNLFAWVTGCPARFREWLKEIAMRLVAAEVASVVEKQAAAIQNDSLDVRRDQIKASIDLLRDLSAYADKDSETEQELLELNRESIVASTKLMVAMMSQPTVGNSAERQAVLAGPSSVGSTSSASEAREGEPGEPTEGIQPRRKRGRPRKIRPGEDANPA